MQKNKRNLHHAYVIERPGGQSFGEILTILENEIGIKSAGNPDFFAEELNTFSIDDSRNLKKLHMNRPTSSESKRIFFIFANGINHESQNALLKIFEEPYPGVHFFICLPSLGSLLPTLMSRLMKMELSFPENSSLSKDAKKFIDAKPKERLEICEKLIKQLTNESISKQNIIDFVNSVIKEVRGFKKIQDISDKNRRLLETCLLAEDYMKDRSASVKQLLEFISLS